MKIRWRTVISLGATFAFGFSLGLFGSDLVRMGIVSGLLPPPPSAELRLELFLQKFSVVHGLDSAQTDQLRTALMAQRKKLSDLRSEIMPKIEAIREETRMTIRAMLPSNERGKFDERHRRMQENRRQMGGGGPEELMFDVVPPRRP